MSFNLIKSGMLYCSLHVDLAQLLLSLILSIFPFFVDRVFSKWKCQIFKFLAEMEFLPNGVLITSSSRLLFVYIRVSQPWHSTTDI